MNGQRVMKMTIGRISEKYRCTVDKTDYLLFQRGDGVFNDEARFYFEIYNKNSEGDMEDTAVCLNRKQVELMVVELQLMLAKPEPKPTKHRRYDEDVQGKEQED
jgi:hypothetical protein